MSGHNKRMLRWLFAIAGTFVVAAGPAAAQMDVPKCLNDWSEASVVVRREGLVTVEQLVKQAPAHLGGDIVRVALCQSDTGFFYRLVVRDGSGSIRQVILDARQPFQPQ